MGLSCGGVGYPFCMIDFLRTPQRQDFRGRRHLWLIVFVLLFMAIEVRAQEPEVPLSPLQRRAEAVNDFHNRLGQRIFRISESVDDFFGDRRMEDEPVETRFRIRSQFRLYEGAPTQIKFKIRANAVFPKTQRRIGFFVESLREDFLTDFNEVLGDESSEDDPENPLADDNVSGLRVSLFRDFPGRWTLDGGFRLSSDPKTRVRLRWQYDWQAFEEWNMRFTQGVEYREELGPGIRTEFRWERLISDRLLRFSLEGVRFDEDPTESLFSIDHYLPVNSDATIRVTASELGFIDSEAQLNGSSLEVAWRRRVFFEWLYVEVAPKMFWSDIATEGREFSTFVAFEVVFVN